MAQTLQTDSSQAVDHILEHYRCENPGVRANLYRMMMTGRLAGTGKLVILPVDQGFEHGPARSFAVNPAGYDPGYHAQLAIDAGCNAYAAPFGFISHVAHEFAGKIPLILKMNNHDVLCDENDPAPAQTASVKDALRLGCAAIGFTIYPGSAHWKAMYENLRALAEEARSNGLAVVVWSYPRGSALSKEGETAIDVVAYAAQIAAQLGAHVIKVKLPSDHLEQDAAKKVYQSERIPVATMAERVKHVMQSSFAGKRIVVFSGGGKKGEDAMFDEARAIRDGGGNGSIIGRNSFQRPKADAVKFLRTVMDIYAGKID
ncbi:MAG TPA: class I fructose-bisphosphate aldolase [Candidatus Krumholzibacteria bacterium]|nr:class I fructose-bisphosphate aldolase [Candidatus Krumholzibacteria bacterium]